MLRLARIKRILQKYQEFMNVSQYLSMYFLFFVVLFLMHMLSCFFYMFGNGVEDMPMFDPPIYPVNGSGHICATATAPGCGGLLSCAASIHPVAGLALLQAAGAYDQPPTELLLSDQPVPLTASTSQAGDMSTGPVCILPPIKGWVCREFGCEYNVDSDGVLRRHMGHHHGPASDSAILPTFEYNGGMRYITSLYFVFNALEPVYNTTAERIFAVFAELVMALIYGALAGIISSIMIGMRGNEQEFQNKIRSLRGWLVEKEIPKPMQVQITRYFNQLWSSKTMFNEGEILSEMPPSMGSELSTFLYGHFLKTIPLFRGLGDEVIFRLCRAVLPMMAIKGQVVIEEGSPGTEMYLLMKGEVEVSKGGAILGFLSEGSFFGEIPVLSVSRPTERGRGEEPGSEIRTRTVKAVTDCQLCFLTRERTRELQSCYPELEARASMSAAQRQAHSVFVRGVSA